VIAVLYEQLGNMEKARTHYHEAFRLAPESGLVANNLGRFLCGQGEFEAADKHFAKATTDPFYRSPETALLNRGSCAMASGNLALAGESLRQAMEVKPDMPDALFQSAMLAMKNKNPLRARAFLERYLSSTPASASVLAFGAEIETALRDTRAAQRYQDRIVQEFPESVEADSLNRSAGSR
jgi:type IV pilus assembly protein PilF